MSDTTYPAYDPIFDGVEMGIGTWSWGDRYFWEFGRGYGEADISAAFSTCVESGVTFFDTAEIYGKGRSEEYLGRFSHNLGSKITVASKFIPLPWRISRNSLSKALSQSLSRLNVNQLDLYQVHYPFPPVTIETWMEAMAGAYQSGLIQAIGVSNYNCQQMKRAYDHLIRQGIRLASNQVEYNLLNRSIEKDNLFAVCKDLGIKIIAFSPLAKGVLSGKYSPLNPPRDIISRSINYLQYKDLQPLIKLLKNIGDAHEGKTPAQVALNWVICKGAIPIPGVKNSEQARQNCGAKGWRLQDEEVAELDKLSQTLQRSRLKKS